MMNGSTKERVTLNAFMARMTMKSNLELLVTLRQRICLAWMMKEETL